DEALPERFARLLFHTPFPKMAMKAHRRLVEVDWRSAPSRWAGLDPAALDAAAEASYRELAAPGLEAVARVGNTYTASLYLCLAALLEKEGRALAEKRLGLFSYGSGCCAEFFAGTIPERIAGDAGVAAVLAARTFID